MSAGKVFLLMVYALLSGLMLFKGDVGIGIWSGRLLILIAAVHLVEIALFFKFCQKAGGSLPLHLLHVFAFGVLHVNEVDEAIHAREMRQAWLAREAEKSEKAEKARKAESARKAENTEEAPVAA